MVNQNAGRIHRHCLAKSDSVDSPGNLRLALVERASHVVALARRDKTDWYALIVRALEHAVYHFTESTISTNSDHSAVIVNFEV